MGRRSKADIEKEKQLLLKGLNVLQLDGDIHNHMLMTPLLKKQIDRELKLRNKDYINNVIHN